jgi:hypothetical protein
MKIPKVIPIIVLILVVAVGFKTVVLRKPDTRLIYTAQEETFLENIQVSGIFHKTTTETERPLRMQLIKAQLVHSPQPGKIRKQPTLPCGQKDK